MRQTGAKVLAHRNAKDSIAGMDRGLSRRRRRQGGQDRGARSAGHARPHDVPRVPASRTPSSRRSSAAIRCSTPAPGTATTAAIRRSSTRRSRSSSRSCPRRRRSTRATTTSRTTCASRSTASPTTRAPARCRTALAGHDPDKAIRHDARRRAADQHVLPADEPDGDRETARGLSRPARAIPISGPYS